MEWKELFGLCGDEADPTLHLLDGVSLDPQTRLEALALSVLKWEAMLELGPTEDGGAETCGMCMLHYNNRHHCKDGTCGVNCLDLGSPHHAWQNYPDDVNAQAVLDQLKAMYQEELYARSTD